MSDVTRILGEIEQGDPAAAEQLLPLVYNELRQLAAAKLASEKPGQTLQATALVHEAYLRLVGSDVGGEWDNRRHFFSSAAKAMRRILLNRARDKGRLKRGGGRRRLDLDLAQLATNTSPEDLIDLDDALTRLANEDQAVSDLAQLRIFAGLPTADAAKVLGVSSRTADRYWAYARAWLFEELHDAG